MRLITYSALVGLLQLRDANAAQKSAAFCADLLSSASYELWERPIPIVETVQSNAAVTLTNGLMDPAVIGYGSFYKVFTADPRIPNRVGQLIDASAADGDGIYCQTSESTVFVLYRKEWPRFTSTAYDNAATYAVGDLVLFTDGNCWRCVTATTAGQSPTNTAAKWDKQVVLDRTKDALLLYARGLILQGVESEKAQGFFDAAERMLEKEKRLFRDMYPWCCDNTAIMGTTTP